MMQTVSLKHQDLGEMLSQVSENLIGQPLRSFGVVPLAKLFKKGQIDAYFIELNDGAKKFAVLMACSHAHALTLAARTLDKPHEALTQALTQDAAREWLNILAGQIKSLAGLDQALALPTPGSLATQESWDALRDTSGMWCEIAQLGVVLWVGFAGPPPVLIKDGDH